MEILILWFLLGLLVIKINAAVTTISAPTTLSGDQTFSDDIVIESGATLALVSGASYSFNGNIDVKGTLDIIGDSTKGLTSLQFGSTTTITNSGNINIENIKSAGSASDFVISPASIDNSGTFTVSQLNAAATVPGTNFTIAPTGSFINTGTIDYDTADKGGTTNGFLYLGTIINNGVIKSGGFAGLINQESYLVPSRYDMKGIIFNNPLEGHGRVTGNDGAVVLLNTGTLGEQTFDINNGMYIINPKVVPSSLNVKNSIGSMLVFLGVEYQSWNADNFGTSAEGQQINFAIDGHRYWFNTSCAGGWQQSNDPFVVTPSDSQYQIGGTFIYLDTFYYFPFCSQPITKTTTITSENLIIKATTISTITTSTTNQYGLTVTEIIYDVAVPAASTLSTTTTGDVTAPTTSTFTTIVTDNNGSSSTEVVVVVITPHPSTLSTTTTGDVTVPTTSTYTTIVTNSNGSSSSEVVVVVITPAPSTLSTTTTGDVTAPTTSTYTTIVTDNNGSSSTEVVVVVITPHPSTLSTTTTGDVTAPTTSTFTTIVTDNNGSSSTEVVVVVITPAASGSVISTTATGAVTAPTTSTYTTVVTDSNGSSSTEVVVVVITPAPSTLSTTATGAVTAPTTSTYTTVVTDSNGSSSTEVVVVVITPAASGSVISTTATGAVTAPTTSTYTTVVTDSNGSSSTEVVVVVITPAPSTLSTTATGAVTAPTTSTYTTVVTDSNGSSSTEVVVVVITPAPSTLSTTATGAVTAPTTSTYTTVVTDSNGSSSTEVVVVVITPAASGSVISTTATGAVTAPTTSTYTTVVTDSNGSSSTEVVVVVITPAPSTLSTTATGAVTAPTTSTYTTVVTDSNGSSSTEVVVVVITPVSFSSFKKSSTPTSSLIYQNFTIPNERIESTLSNTLVVLTTVVNGVTMTITYCPEPSETSRTSTTAIIGHSSIESVYSRNQHDGTNSFSAVSNATPVISIAPTTTGPVFTNNENHPISGNFKGSSTAVGNGEFRKPGTSASTMAPQISQYVSEQSSSSPKAMTLSHGGTPSLVSYEGKGSTIYMKWSVTHFIGLLLLLLSNL